MNSYVQLICLVFSFLYGIIINYFNKINLRIVKDKNIFIKVLIICLYIFNISLLYMVFLYRLNYGMLHYYFILFIILGYFSVDVKKRKL